MRQQFTASQAIDRMQAGLIARTRRAFVCKLGLGAIVLGITAGCSPDRFGVPPETPAPDGAASAFDQPAYDSITAVMHGKLVHAQAILSGLVTSDYAAIESHAQALRRISERGEWVVNDSAAYFAMSSRFREICDQLTMHARDKQLDAASDDYTVLTRSCVSCHTYLRHEREVRGFPGRVSLRGVRQNVPVIAKEYSTQIVDASGPVRQ